MLNIFKRRKSGTTEEPAEIPQELKIARALNRLMGLDGDLRDNGPDRLSEALTMGDSSDVYHLCANCDIFPLTLILPGGELKADKISHLLNEMTGLETLHYSCPAGDLPPLLWQSYRSHVLSGPEDRYFILLEETEGREGPSDRLRINRSREFRFGRLVCGDMTVNGSPLSPSYNGISFNPSGELPPGHSLFGCRFAAGNREFNLWYSIEGTGPVISLVAKEMIKTARVRMEEFLSEKIRILSAGPADRENADLSGGYRLEGKVFTTGGSLPFTLTFSKPWLNLFDADGCSTVKGKILQINRQLFLRDYAVFHKSHNRFLLTDLMEILPDRDLSLICQNFFVSRSLGGPDLRKLFRYLVRKGDKTRVLSLPFPASDRFLSHLPSRLRDEYSRDRSSSPSLEELVSLNGRVMEDLYNQMTEGRLLLSPNSRALLEKETGIRLKESRMLRLRKLISDKRYLNALVRMDGNKIQVFLGAMNHTCLADTFVYQTDRLPLIKPYLSRNRFGELMEDISYTGKKIKTGQIDINRICDSIEKFNGEVRLFIENERSEL